jgi:hypothetical protein
VCGVQKKSERLLELALGLCQGLEAYVKNLDDTIDDDKRAEFVNFGEIISAKGTYFLQSVELN